MSSQKSFGFLISLVPMFHFRDEEARTGGGQCLGQVGSCAGPYLRVPEHSPVPPQFMADHPLSATLPVVSSQNFEGSHNWRTSQVHCIPSWGGQPECRFLFSLALTSASC